LDDAALLAECKVDRYRASGPGGQKRNKTDSAVRLRHAGTGLAALATESRSQHENRRRALRRLRLKIALELRETIDPEQAAPGVALRRFIGADRLIACNPRNADFPLVMAELLDWLVACDGQVSAVAGRIGVSTSSLTRFFHGQTQVWRKVQEVRKRCGLGPLRSKG